MPAFAKSAGGILDTNQVESLVEFLVQTYPAPVLRHPRRTSIRASSLP